MQADHREPTFRERWLRRRRSELWHLWFLPVLMLAMLYIVYPALWLLFGFVHIVAQTVD